MEELVGIPIVHEQVLQGDTQMNQIEESYAQDGLANGKSNPYKNV